MGRRHQIFIIARVRRSNESDPDTYRCILAWHDQCCYGRDPLRHVRRVISQCQRPLNAAIVRDELRIIRERYGSEEELPDPWELCPYTAFLFGTAWQMDLKNKYVRPSWAFRSASMGSWDGDNNDGITVIDITNPDQVAYAFLVNNYNYDTRRCTIEFLDAEGYVRIYYPLDPEDSDDEDAYYEPEVEEDVQRCIKALDECPLVKWNHLAETWPDEYRMKGNDETALDPSARSVPLLSDVVLQPAIEHALSSGDEPALESLVDMFPMKTGTIKRILLTQSPFPDSAVSALSQILADELDKSAGRRFTFPTLDEAPSIMPAQYVAIFKRSIVKSKTKPRSLDLSHTSIDIDTLKEIIALSSTTLEQVILLNTTISNNSLHDLLSSSPSLFTHITSIIHPAFLDLCFNPSYRPEHDERYDGFIVCTANLGTVDPNVKDDSHYYSRSKGPTVQVFLPGVIFATPAYVLQGFDEYLALFDGKVNRYREVDYLMTLQTAWSGSVRSEEEVGVSTSDTEGRDIPRVVSVPRNAAWRMPGNWVLGLVVHEGCLVRYGFFKIPVWAKDLEVDPESEDSPMGTIDIRDLKGFLEDAKAEGRVDPPTYLVESVQKRLTRLECDESLRVQRDFTKLTMLSEDEAFKIWKINCGKVTVA